MSGMTCLACGAEVTNGLGLCAACQQALRVTLTDVASFYADVLRIQPGQRVKVRGAYQSTPPPLTRVTFDPVTIATCHVDTIVVGWVRYLQDDRPQVGQPPADVGRACGWLESHVGSIATLAWGHEILSEMRDCERMLRQLIDRSDTGWYAGICGNEVGRATNDEGEVETVTCPRNLYGTQGSTWVRCPECGRTWDSSERRAVMMTEARDQLAPIAVIARAVVGLVDGQSSVQRLDSRIRKAVKAERLQSMGVRVLADGKPHRVYRIGDVFDMLGEKAPDVRDVKPQAC